VNYFELYPGDYLRDTTRLSLLEHGAYLRLMLAYYGEEEPLPADHAELYTIVSAVSAADKSAVRKVADRYFPVGEDGVRRNGRADEEIAKAQKRMSISRENGAKGGRPKKPAENPAGNPAENPAGFENPGFSKPGRNPQETQSGEALQTPQATSHASTAGATHITGQALGGGTPAGSLAAELNRAGIRVTSQDPRLIAAAEAGITAAEVIEQRNVYPDKPAAYLLKAATSQRVEGAQGEPHAARKPARRLSAVERVHANIERARRDRGEQPDDETVIDGTAVRVAN
jgi:uncharacterized protein YdaU (DUF1376 family)